MFLFALSRLSLLLQLLEELQLYQCLLPSRWNGTVKNIYIYLDNRIRTDRDVRVRVLVRISASSLSVYRNKGYFAQSGHFQAFYEDNNEKTALHHIALAKIWVVLEISLGKQLGLTYLKFIPPQKAFIFISIFHSIFSRSFFFLHGVPVN